jgi:hypothetical protein
MTIRSGTGISAVMMMESLELDEGDYETISNIIKELF